MTNDVVFSGKTFYLAGPMRGIPQFNFPKFIRAAEVAREQGMIVVSPVELDQEENAGFDASLSSEDGVLTEQQNTWGQYLGRDVEIVADQCEGVIFLAGWEASQGARLEAYVSLTLGFEEYYHFVEVGQGVIKPYPRAAVLAGVLGGLK